jgi:hypothetical protein
MFRGGVRVAIAHDSRNNSRFSLKQLQMCLQQWNKSFFV